jgi:hypothetical protein
MNILARFSVLLVALLVSGFSFGFALVRADELPEDTNKIESLTPEQARKLAKEFSGTRVWVESKRGKYCCDRCLVLNGLKSLDAVTASVLAGYSKGPLLLNGLTTLDAETAMALAEFPDDSLYLDGLATLDARTAKVVAQFKCGWLFLNGLTTLDADAAKSLAAFNGYYLSLGGLPALSDEATKALTQQNGFSLSLYGLTTLPPKTAKALAAADKWDGLLPNLTALDSPDSVAIAKALATRKGPLYLRNLKKISPKTLTALIQKEDVEIPLIETLELIQEPDGSPTDDFLIPEGFQERQKQQSQ